MEEICEVFSDMINGERKKKFFKTIFFFFFTSWPISMLQSFVD